MKKLIISFVSLSLLIASCKKDNPTPTPTSTTNNTNTTTVPANAHFMKATVDGTVINLYAGVNGCGEGTSFGQSMGFYSFEAYISVPSPETTPDLSVSFSGNSLFTDQNDDTDSSFYAIFKLGNHIFNTANISNGTPSIDIIYTLYENGQPTDWLSSLGDQTGSSFKVTEIKPSTNYMGASIALVKGTFNCKIYNSDNPSISKTVTNATFYLQFDKEW